MLDSEGTHRPDHQQLENPTSEAAAAIMYPAQSFVLTTVPVLEASAFGIVKLQADVTDTPVGVHTVKAMAYVGRHDNSFQFHASGQIRDILGSSSIRLVDQLMS